MKREKFESLVPEFFCALGRLYAQNPAFFWGHLYHVVRYLLEILACFQELRDFEDFEYGLDDLVSPLLEEFVRSEDPNALWELMVELGKVRAYLKDELKLRNPLRP
jgi:hypothetical protein